MIRLGTCRKGLSTNQSVQYRGPRCSQKGSELGRSSAAKLGSKKLVITHLYKYILNDDKISEFLQFEPLVVSKPHPSVVRSPINPPSPPRNPSKPPPSTPSSTHYPSESSPTAPRSLDAHSDCSCTCPQSTAAARRPTTQHGRHSRC